MVWPVPATMFTPIPSLTRTCLALRGRSTRTSVRTRGGTCRARCQRAAKRPCSTQSQIPAASKVAPLAKIPARVSSSEILEFASGRRTGVLQSPTKHCVMRANTWRNVANLAGRTALASAFSASLARRLFSDLRRFPEPFRAALAALFAPCPDQVEPAAAEITLQ